MKLKKTKVKHMESKFYRSREEILLCMWKDKKSKKKKSLLYQLIKEKESLKYEISELQLLRN